MKAILTTFILLLVFTSYSQLLTQYDNMGLTAQYRFLIANKSARLENTSNFTYGLGLYYDFVKSDFFSVPIYLTYSRGQYNLKEFKKVNKDHIDLELDYKRYLLFGMWGRAYVEGGAQGRRLIGSDKVVLTTSEELAFKQFSALVKIGIGFEGNIGNSTFYLSFDYYHSFIELFNGENGTINKYFGARLSFLLID